MFTPQYIFNVLKNQKRPFKFLLSRFLWYSRLCKFFIIKGPYGIKLHFYPTSLSASLWIDSNDRNHDVHLVYNYLQKNDVFIDVGANIGELALIGARKVGKSGQVIAIEPHPKIFKFLVNNIRLNKLGNVKTYNVALGDKEGFFHFSDLKSDDQNFITVKGPIKIKVKKLDNLFKGEKINLLKIDTEGYELFVLKGAINLLPKTELIYFEAYEKNFKRYHYSTMEVLRLLENCGFKIFRFAEKNKLVKLPSTYLSKKCENLVAIKNIYRFKRRIKKINLKIDL